MIFLCGFYANFVVLENNIDKTNPFLTTANFISHHSLFAIGIVSFLLMITCDLILVWSLFFLTNRISLKLSYVASSLRLLHAFVFIIALYQLFRLYFLTKAGVANSNNLQLQVAHLLSNFDTIWTIGLLFFGFHLIVLAYLTFKSTIVPKLLSVLIMIASLGYLIDSTAKLMLANYENYQPLFETGVVLTGVIGELSFTIWLLYKGFKKTASIEKPFHLNWNELQYRLTKHFKQLSFRWLLDCCLQINFSKKTDF